MKCSLQTAVILALVAFVQPAFGGQYCDDYLAVLEGEYVCWVPEWPDYCGDLNPVMTGGGKGSTPGAACEAAADDMCTNYASTCNGAGGTYLFCDYVIYNVVMPLVVDEPSCGYAPGLGSPCFDVNWSCSGY